MQMQMQMQMPADVSQPAQQVFFFVQPPMQQYSSAAAPMAAPMAVAAPMMEAAPMAAPAPLAYLPQHMAPSQYMLVPQGQQVAASPLQPMAPVPVVGTTGPQVHRAAAAAGVAADDGAAAEAAGDAVGTVGRVGGSTKAAATLAQHIDEGKTVVLRASGVMGTTAVVKRIVDAHKLLQAWGSGHSFTVTPAFVSAQKLLTKGKGKMRLWCMPMKTARTQRSRVLVRWVEITPTSVVGKIAGAVARLMRAGYRQDTSVPRRPDASIMTLAVSPDKVSTIIAMKSLALARSMLTDDDDTDFHAVYVPHDGKDDAEGDSKLVFSIERCPTRDLDEYLAGGMSVDIV